MNYSSRQSVFEMWSETSTKLFKNTVDANRAALSAMTVPGKNGNGDGVPDAEDRIEPADDLAEWEATVDADGQPAVGDTVRFSKTLSEADVDRFAAASGDTNPIHLDETWAEETRFEGRIVHGTLAAGLISAALARFPGSVIYLSQDLEFRAPVRLGDRVEAEATVVEALDEDRYRLRTTVDRGDTNIIDGEAVVIIDHPSA